MFVATTIYYAITAILTGVFYDDDHFLFKFWLVFTLSIFAMGFSIAGLIWSRGWILKTTSARRLIIPGGKFVCTQFAFNLDDDSEIHISGEYIDWVKASECKRIQSGEGQEITGARGFTWEDYGSFLVWAAEIYNEAEAGEVSRKRRGEIKLAIKPLILPLCCFIFLGFNKEIEKKWTSQNGLVRRWYQRFGRFKIKSLEINDAGVVLAFNNSVLLHSKTQTSKSSKKSPGAGWKR